MIELHSMGFRLDNSNLSRIWWVMIAVINTFFHSCGDTIKLRFLRCLWYWLEIVNENGGSPNAVSSPNHSRRQGLLNYSPRLPRKRLMEWWTTRAIVERLPGRPQPILVPSLLKCAHARWEDNLHSFTRLNGIPLNATRSFYTALYSIGHSPLSPIINSW